MRLVIALAIALCAPTAAMIVTAGPAHADTSACESAQLEPNLDHAIRLYTVCIQKGSLYKSELALAYNARGVAYFAKGDIDNAIADFTRAITVDKGYGEPYYYRAEAYLTRHQTDLAAADLDIAVDAPGNYRALAYTLRGTLREAHADYAGATGDFDDAIKYNRRLASAYNAKAWLLATCVDAHYRDGAQALKLAKKAISLQDGWQFHETLAAAYAETGSYGDAAREEQGAIDTAPADTAADTMKKMRARLALYQANTPYRDEAPQIPGGAT